jgi:hypothetical protein
LPPADRRSSTGDACLGVVGALDLGVTLGVVTADDLDNRVGAEPIAVLSAWVVRVAHEQNVRLAMLAGSDLEAKRSILDFAADALDTREECQKDELSNGLVFIRRHRQHLDITIAEFEQASAVINHGQVQFLGPEALDRPQIERSLVIAPHNMQLS